MNTILLRIAGLLIMANQGYVQAQNAPEIIAKAKHSVVQLNVYDTAHHLLRSGTGFFYNSQGDILTNYHVVENGASVEAIRSDGMPLNFLSVARTDAEADLATLSFHLPMGVAIATPT